MMLARTEVKSPVDKETETEVANVVAGGMDTEGLVKSSFSQESSSYTVTTAAIARLARIDILNNIMNVKGLA